jgi:hypothetical protein
VYGFSEKKSNVAGAGKKISAGSGLVLSNPDAKKYFLLIDNNFYEKNNYLRSGVGLWA